MVEETQNSQTWKNMQVQGGTEACAGCHLILKHHCPAIYYLSSAKPSVSISNAVAKRDTVENAMV